MSENDTPQPSFAEVGEFAYLEVASNESVGAFLDWGKPKDLLLPFREQTRDLRVGDGVLVYLYVDNTQRPCASMRIDKYVDETPGEYHEGQRVSLMIANRTDLGYRAIIEGRHLGVLYENEVFQSLRPGQYVVGYIKKVRPDGKIDLSLQQAGIRGAGDIAQRIQTLLEEQGGFLPVGDKTPADVIANLFGVSKKKFKMALGGLYKAKLVTIEEDGIRLREG